MNDVNWWLVALSFVLGLVLTGVFMIRRVTREVPVYVTGAATSARLAGGTPTKVVADARATVVPKVVQPAADDDAEAPYGAGSLRIARGTTAPPGFPIKGNEDSMLYHTTDSPLYARTVAEVWFREEDVAERAGFARWDTARAGAATSVSSFVDSPPGPHGPGSAKPGAGGSGPEGWTVKGNEDSKLYHSEESPSYGVTRGEVWFRDVETAEAAGFNRWDSGKSQRGKR